MSTYPVHYSIERPAEFSRLQLAARLIAFIVLGLVGISFGTLFLIAYLALPVYAATRLSGGRSAPEYVDRDGPRVLGLLRWLAAISAWAGLIAERFPERSPTEIVKLEVEGTAHPTASSALWRVITGLPSALLLAVLCWLGCLVWLWAALSILVRRRVGTWTFDYLVGLQRWSLRLLAYQASLVDAYPPFSFADPPPPALPTARVAS
jgi:hypothetical protein